MDCTRQATAHGILQARILVWVVMPSSRGLPNPGIELMSLVSPALTGGFLTTSATGEALLFLFLFYIGSLQLFGSQNLGSYCQRDTT